MIIGISCFSCLNKLGIKSLIAGGLSEYLRFTCSIVQISAVSKFVPISCGITSSSHLVLLLSKVNIHLGKPAPAKSVFNYFVPLFKILKSIG